MRGLRIVLGVLFCVYVAGAAHFFLGGAMYHKAYNFVEVVLYLSLSMLFIPEDEVEE